MGFTNLQHSLRKKYSALTGELAEVRSRIEHIHREQENEVVPPSWTVWRLS